MRLVATLFGHIVSVLVQDFELCRYMHGRVNLVCKEGKIVVQDQLATLCTTTP